MVKLSMDDRGPREWGVELKVGKDIFWEHEMLKEDAVNMARRVARRLGVKHSIPKMKAVF